MLPLSPQNRPLDILISILKTAVIISVAAILTVYATKLVGGLSLSVNQVSTQKQTTFDITGESNITQIPDEAMVQVGINVNEGTVAQAQTKINQTINNITAAIKKIDIEDKDIKTADYSIYPNYDYQSGRSITGYTASTNLNITVRDFEKLNQVIDLATANGANSVSGVSFKLSEKKEAEAKKQAREEAINKAKENAEELAKLAGMKLGKIVNVYEQPNYYPPTPYMERAVMAVDGKGGGAPTEVQPGSTTYSYSVTISYETL